MKSHTSISPFRRALVAAAVILAAGNAAALAQSSSSTRSSSSSPNSSGNYNSSSSANTSSNYDSTSGSGMSNSSSMQNSSDTSRDRMSSNNNSSDWNSSSASSSRSSDKLSWSDKRFVTKAADDGQDEVQLAQLATQKASSPDVRNFAQQLVQDHTQVNSELMSIASTKNVKLDKDNGQDRTYRRLSKASGNEFDREFIEHMVDEHEKDIKMFEKAASNAKDTEIRQFASKHVDHLRQHLAQAQQLQQSIVPTGRTDSDSWRANSSANDTTTNASISGANSTSNNSSATNSDSSSSALTGRNSNAGATGNSSFNTGSSSSSGATGSSTSSTSP